jgi:hypothetical protein
MDTTFMLGGICNLKWKLVKKLSQRQQLLFTGAERHSKFASRLCKIRRAKHLSAFVEVAEGSFIYNVAIYHLVHFSLKFRRKPWLKEPNPIEPAPSRASAPPSAPACATPRRPPPCAAVRAC